MIQKDKGVIARPKFFPKKYYDSALGEVYDCGPDFFKIPVTPRLYSHSNFLLRRINKDYSISDLEALSIFEYYMIPADCIVQHFHPRNTFGLNDSSVNADLNAEKLLAILDEQGLREVVGVGGSMMMGLSNTHSDIDLVIYGLENVTAVRDVLSSSAEMAPRTFNELKRRYQQHSPSFRNFISFDEYVFHELSKSHRGYFNGTKLTINIVDPFNHPRIPTKSTGLLTELSGIVIKDTHRLTHPMELVVEVSPTFYVKVISLSRVFTDQVKVGDYCCLRGIKTRESEMTIIVHDAIGGIKTVK